MEERHLLGDWDDNTTSHRPQAPTLYWQAIVACNSGGRLSDGGGMSQLCESTVAGPDLQRGSVLATKCELSPFQPA